MFLNTKQKRKMVIIWYFESLKNRMKTIKNNKYYRNNSSLFLE